MPVYLVHGFRWPRQMIRVHVIINNLDDAAPDYIMSAKTPHVLISSLRERHPDIIAALPNLSFVEQYDPEDESFNAYSQPYAFVCDKVVKQNLCIDVGEVQAQGLPANIWDAMADLRDEIAKGEKIGWWVVYNGDPERAGAGSTPVEGQSPSQSTFEHSQAGSDAASKGKRGKGGIRKWFSGGKSSKT